MLVVCIPPTLSTKKGAPDNHIDSGMEFINFVAQQQRSGQLKAAAGGKTK